jgi:hypothetical protein
MNHQEFLAAITSTIGASPLPGAPRWSLEFPHGGKLEIQPAGDGNPYVFMQVLGWPAEQFPDGANRYLGTWNISPSFREDYSEAALYQQCLKELQRRLAKVGWAPPVRSGWDSHDLYQTGDPDAPQSIKDSNGEVCLGLCKKCGRAEVELSEPCEPKAGLVEDQIDLYKAYADSHGLTRTEGKFELLAIAYNDRAATPLHRYSISQVEVGNGSGDWNIEQQIEKDPQGEWVKYADLNPGKPPMTEGDEAIDAQIRGLLEGGGATEDLEAVKAFFRAAGLPESTAERVRNALCSAEVKAGLNPVEREAVLHALSDTVKDLTLRNQQFRTKVLSSAIRKLKG